MVEPIVAFVAVLILFALFVWLGNVAEELLPLAAVPFGLVALYFVVRIIRWAWETPIPTWDR
jgi:sorbitol-specific phosphotransferase system component IIBC